MIFLRSCFIIWFFSFSTVLFSNSIFATIFLPAPLSKQVEASDVIIQGDFSKKSSKKINGHIVTAYKFRVQKYASKNSVEVSLQDKEYIEFYQPGGTIGSEAVSVSGTVEFTPKEYSTLILKKGADGNFWLASLGLGKYEYKNSEANPFWSSTIFPKDKELGKISEEQWEKLIGLNFRSKWKTVLPEIQVKTIDKNKIVYERKTNSQRKIASEKAKPYSFTWMISVMAILFVVGMWLSKEKQVNE